VSETVDWDEPVSDEIATEWDIWKNTLKDIETLRIPRTYVPYLTKKLSLFKSQFNPRLRCNGLSSDSKSRSFRLVARSSDGKADITLGSFDANLCRRRFPSSIIASNHYSAVLD
jgi:hypothetical protein